MRQDRRDPFVTALEDARRRGYPSGEYVGQESFMTATQIRELALRAGIGAGTSVLDLCCGVAGPGRMIAAEFDCCYLGVDYSASALQIARYRVADLPTAGRAAQFVRQRIPPLPSGRFDVVLLLETLLAFPDKATLFEGIGSALGSGGRFACTVELGDPLSPREQLGMPDADTVWLLDWAELINLLAGAGLSIVWSQDCTAAHQSTASDLLSAYRSDAARIAELIGQQATEELITAHQLWSDWLATGRVQKFAVVAQQT